MRCSRIALTVGGVLLVGGSAQAANYTFDTKQLGLAGQNVDVSLFEQGGQLPGTYMVDVVVNGATVDSREIVFNLVKDASGRSSLQPCLSADALLRYGIKVESYPGLGGREAQCAKLAAIPQATSTFNFNDQRLLLSIPQVALRSKVVGIAPQAQWDDGMPALLLNYRANVNRTEYRNSNGSGFDNDNNSQFVQLDPGLNVGAWRLRNSTTWQKNGDPSGKWQTAYTYAERGINDWKSRLTLGERYTSADVFDSVPFRGVMLATDDNMVPYNQRSFAPVVRGIARTQARVEVKQNGFTVYSDTVAPGPFALTDLTPSGNGGDLEVTVWETDGKPQVFTVPYNTPAIALHEGYLKYSVMGGTYRSSQSAVDDTGMGQATVMYGLPWNLTAYSGAQGAEHYQAGTLGMGVSMGDWGSMSLDGTWSHGQRKDQDMEDGGMWRVRYTKAVAETDTSFSLTNTQSSKKYNTLSDVLDSYRSGDGYVYLPGSNGVYYYYTDGNRSKNRTTVTLSQSMGGWGYLNLNGTREEYWNQGGHNDSYGISYGFGVKDISVTLGWTQNKIIDSSGGRSNDRVTSLMVSVPLDRWLSGNSVNATYQLTAPSDGGATQEAGLNGDAFSRQLHWDVRQRYRSGDENGDHNESAMNLNWNGGYGQVGANYSYSPSVRQMGGSVAGGVVVHRHGVTLGQPLGSTVALVEAPGAADVSVGSWPGVSTDFRGYTTLGYMSPYQENTVSLDPASLPSNAEITQTDARVVPTTGAVVAAKFATRVGGRALMTVTQSNGQVVPFGALAMLAGQNVGAGVVGEGGEVYLTGLPNEGVLKVQWSGQQCSVNYRLPTNKGVAGVYTMVGQCR
ncbi:fimbria/pilus outer membrane usher protein [Serratia marcescens]|nr:fimbria/pilus outer membrane usher protein [Serratia marcescens]MBH2766637.1 fimbria/pilus outer membrane usher protein [Serratia marcescens]MBH2766697.1 fimbria/pilus outer membrane usher protein [Serratia marcescens]